MRAPRRLRLDPKVVGGGPISCTTLHSFEVRSELDSCTNDPRLAPQPFSFGAGLFVYNHRVTRHTSKYTLVKKPAAHAIDDLNLGV